MKFSLAPSSHTLMKCAQLTCCTCTTFGGQQQQRKGRHQHIARDQQPKRVKAVTNMPHHTQKIKNQYTHSDLNT